MDARASENTGKVSCGRVESCPGRNPRERSRAAVRVAIVVRKRGNARGVKGGSQEEAEAALEKLRE